jgi:MFS family permease
VTITTRIIAGPETAADGRAGNAARRGFWVVAAVSFLYLFSSSAPSPLYGLYAARWHFSPTTLTAIFAVYALALLATMLVAGSISDAIGRRPVILAALVVQAGAMVLFLAATSVGWLCAARIAQGCATGLVTAAVAATLVDLQPAGKPGFGPLVNVTVQPAGLAFGALLSGALVQYAPAPTRLVYGLLLAGFAAMLLVVAALIPETVPVRRRPSLGTRIGIERPVLRAFLVTTPVIVALWALAGLYLSLGPSLVQTLVHSDNALVGGSIVGVLSGFAAISGIVVRNWLPCRSMLVGCAMLGTGVLVTVLAIWAISPVSTDAATVLLYLGAAVSGCGFGVGFLGAFRSLVSLAKAERRSELIAAIYVVVYLSFSVPCIIAGLLTTHIGLNDTAIGYGLVVAALAWLALPTTGRHCRRN